MRELFKSVKTKSTAPSALLNGGIQKPLLHGSLIKIQAKTSVMMIHGSTFKCHA
jgi:hypothetical protein